MTDDRGNYRVSGLPTGKYIVQAILSMSRTITYISSSNSSTSSSNSSGGSLIVYSGSTPLLKDTASFTLELNEERAGEDLRIPASKIHTITGYIVSARDGHVINGGQVYLYHADDHSYAGSANTSENDPGFTLSFIYDGEYTLSSPVSFDMDYRLLPQPPGSFSLPQYEGHPLHPYGAASMPLHVDSDMENVTIAVPEAGPQEVQAFKNLVQEQEQSSPPAANANPSN